MIEYLADKPLSTVVGLVIFAVIVVIIVVSEALGKPIKKDPPAYYWPLFPFIYFRRTRR